MSDVIEDMKEAAAYAQQKSGNEIVIKLEIRALGVAVRGRLGESVYSRIVGWNRLLGDRVNPLLHGIDTVCAQLKLIKR